ncbi:hypothetical protein ABENE_16205 [Asticcacaulis benevestitus DSM 16100 = ATCC BAA-896]|uniref:Uncharacterized protein n=1 Tax=Asticcacaulis benevestitus DSM 16100 = ATCC BAA-896 TaxID=1121022 RepID=V4RAD1_9CAUL|nr:hypothetical protein ABENE_16205 [Asticcacaulis benevestitus DSM 16100 = ATCC BAA-896]
MVDIEYSSAAPSGFKCALRIVYDAYIIFIPYGKGPDGGLITCSDVLMDGGVTASYIYGELVRKNA